MGEPAPPPASLGDCACRYSCTASHPAAPQTPHPPLPPPLPTHTVHLPSFLSLESIPLRIGCAASSDVLKRNCATAAEGVRYKHTLLQASSDYELTKMLVIVWTAVSKPKNPAAM